MSASQILQHLYSLDTSSPGISRLIYGLIRHDEEEQYLSSLRGSELARLIDFLDEALSAIITADDVSRQCLRKLQTICGDNMTLPSSYIASGDLSKVGDEPTAFGGFADVWEGTHCDERVCIKTLRVTLNDDPALAKSFFKEVVIWKRLRHPNIVSFIGVTTKPLQIVSEWMPNGTLTKFVEKNPGANRIGLLLDVAEGLNYLHTNHTVHADLKGPNILVDHGGHARLTDFGLSWIVRGTNSDHVTQPQGYTAGWTAPEVLMGNVEITREADMFAFGTVVIEVFTGRNPFSGFKPSFIILQIIRGERPARPQEARELGLVDSVWDMTLSCWQEGPSHRPTVAGVVRFLRECYTLHVANLPLPALAPRRRVGSVDDATSHVSISLTPSNGKPTPTQSPRTSYYSAQSSSQTHGTSPEPSSIDVSRDSRDSSSKPLPKESHGLSNSSNVNGGYPPSIVQEEPMFGEAERRIDEIDEELAHGDQRPVAEGTAELRSLCYEHRTIPTSYKLEGVVRKGDHSHRISQAIEIWKGSYKGEPVALRVLKVSRQDPYVLAFARRLCANVVVLKQVKHENILPFYGVSTTIATFCLVSPWCENGNITDYLEKNPDINRFDLLSDAAGGLRFLHENQMAHCALRPSHILIGDDNVARLDLQSVGDHNNYRYSAPETRFPENYSKSVTPISSERDVYGMGMVAYEVLTGRMPYFGFDDVAALSNIRAGRIPERPSEEIPDPVWQLLEKCWSVVPSERPSAAQVYDVFSELCSIPGKLTLQILSLKISLSKPKQQGFYVKFKYGDRVHKTSLTTKAVAGAEYTWNVPETWLIETDQRHPVRMMSLEVLLRVSRFKSPRVCATGNFSIPKNIDKATHVKLEAPGATGEAVLRIFLAGAL